MGAAYLSSGRVVRVDQSFAGSELVGDHASGATELTVIDAGEFFDNGGDLQVAGDTLTYTGVSGDDEATTTVILSSPTTNAYDSGQKVNVLPLTPKVTADVIRDGEGASETCEVLHLLIPLLQPFGIRDPDDQEFARLMSDREGDGWVVYDVRGKIPVIDGEYVTGGGGGGGLDGGNDDDGFVLPTLAEFVIDGDPEFWLNPDNNQLYTEDEAYAAFDNPYLLDASFSAGTLDYDTVYIDSDDGYDPIMLPAWSIPLLAQLEKITIDSATASGVGPSGLNTQLSCALEFGSMADYPGARSFSMIKHFSLNRDNINGYTDRTWYEDNTPNSGDYPMPASSGTVTFPVSGDLHSRGVVVFAADMALGTGPLSLALDTSTEFTGVRMEQG